MSDICRTDDEGPRASVVLDTAEDPAQQLRHIQLNHDTGQQPGILFWISDRTLPLPRKGAAFSHLLQEAYVLADTFSCLFLGLLPARSLYRPGDSTAPLPWAKDYENRSLERVHADAIAILKTLDHRRDRPPQLWATPSSSNHGKLFFQTCVMQNVLCVDGALEHIVRRRYADGAWWFTAAYRNLLFLDSLLREIPGPGDPRDNLEPVLFKRLRLTPQGIDVPSVRSMYTCEHQETNMDAVVSGLTTLIDGAVALFRGEYPQEAPHCPGVNRCLPWFDKYHIRAGEQVEASPLDTNELLAIANVVRHDAERATPGPWYASSAELDGTERARVQAPAVATLLRGDKFFDHFLDGDEYGAAPWVSAAYEALSVAVAEAQVILRR